jgi:hypothetical protein
MAPARLSAVLQKLIDEPLIIVFLFNVCFWPEAVAHVVAVERPLLMKADVQNARYRGNIIERPVCARHQPFAW